MTAISKQILRECRTIKTHIDRGESTAAQCEKHYKAAGARLAKLKATKPKAVQRILLG